jgi:hypothetical protein
VKANGGMKIEHDEVEYLKKIHHAKSLQELMTHPGWAIYQEIIQDMVERLDNQHRKYALQSSRDGYWISGVRIAAVHDFAEILIQKLDTEVDILNHPLRPPTKTDPADYDGEVEPN